MKLLETPKTFYKFRGQEFTVAYAPALAFDAWARQFYDDIQNVNRLAWTIHNRWQLVNDLLGKGVLSLIRNEGDGSARLVYKDTLEVGGTSPYTPKVGGTYSSDASRVPPTWGGTSTDQATTGSEVPPVGDQGSGTSPEVPPDRS